MANARPTGKLTTGAVGNFLLGAAAALFVLTIGAAMMGGGGAGESAGIMGLVAFVLIIGGGICGAIGWFGMGSLYGGTNLLAGIFSIILGLVPILMIVLAMGAARGGSMSGMAAMGMVGAILAFGVPALLGIFGGLGIMSAKASLAKPAGLVLLLGGAGCALMLVMAVAQIASPTLGSIALYVGFFGLAIGFFLSGATMLAERSGNA